MSMWYQWFIAAPMMIMDLPPVFSAFRANSRATWTIRSAFTPVIFSAQAGVPGTSSA